MDTLLAVVLVCIIGTMLILFICNVKKPPEDPYDIGKYSLKTEDAGCAVKFDLFSPWFPDSASMDSELASEIRANGTRSFSRQPAKPDLPPAYLEVIKENKDELPPPYEPLHMWLVSMEIKKYERNCGNCCQVAKNCRFPGRLSFNTKHVFYRMIAWFIDQPYRRMKSDNV